MGKLLRFDPIAHRLRATPPRERMEALLFAPEPTQRVHEMDAFALYSLVRDVGVSDALELIHLASAEQSQAFLDFDCWDGDHLDRDGLADWFTLLFQSDDEKMERLGAELDSELLGLFLKENLQGIYLYRDEDDAEIIERIPDPIESSPDGVYALVMPADPERAGQVRLVLHRLYYADPDAARELLQAARWELSSAMEEEAYRVRSGRLEQYGFHPREEAVSIYAATDPGKERELARKAAADDDDGPVIDMSAGGRVDLPTELSRELSAVTGDAPSFFGAAFVAAGRGHGGEGTAESLLGQLLTLTNTSIMADLGNPGSPDVLPWAFRRVHGMLNVGLEYLTSQEVDPAARLLGRWPLKRIFRSGFGLLRSVAQQAAQLTARGNLTLVEEIPFSLCNEDEKDLLEGLRQARPLRSALRSEGFESLEELEAAASLLTLLAYKELWTFGLRHHRKEELAAQLYGPPGTVQLVEDIGFDSFLATHAASQLTRGANALRLLDLEGLAALLEEHIHPAGLSPDLSHALALAAGALPTDENAVTRRAAETWVGQVAYKLSQEYGGLTAARVRDAALLPPLLLLRKER